MLSIHSLSSALYKRLVAILSLKNFGRWCYLTTLTADRWVVLPTSPSFLSSFIRLNGRHWCTAIMRLLHKRSISFMSGLCHSRTLTESSRSLCLNVSSVGFGCLLPGCLWTLPQFIFIPWLVSQFSRVIMVSLPGFLKTWRTGIPP